MTLTTGSHALDMRLMQRGWKLGALPVIGDAMRLMYTEEGIGAVALFLAGLTAPTTPPRRTWPQKMDLLFDRFCDRYEARPPRGSAEELAQIGQDMRRRRHAREERARIEESMRKVRGEHRGTDRVARASRYLASIPGGNSGEGRNPVAWGAVLRTVRGFALSEGEACALFEQEYAPRCRPRLPSVELRGMVRRALRATRPEWGAKLQERGTARRDGR